MTSNVQTNLIDRFVSNIRKEGIGATALKTLSFPFVKAYQKIVLPACHKLNIPTPKRTPDRIYLEQTVFPFFAQKEGIKDILFAGSDFYTWHYYQFFPNQSFKTIDFNPEAAKYGTKGQHVVGSVCELEKYYSNESFDVVFFNGLIGFGLDDEKSAHEALTQAYDVLKPGGYLILGWNDMPHYIDFSLETMPEYQRFTPLRAKNLVENGHRIETGSQIKHTFDFLQKI